MTYSAEHFLLAFGGPLHGSEAWSMSLRSTVGGGVEDNPAAHQEVLETLVPIVRTAVNEGTLLIGSAATLAWVKYNRITTAGKYKHGTTALVELSPTVSGGGTSRHAPQVSLVATLETGRSRGLAHRGRIYLPTPDAAIAADGRISAQAAQTVASGVAAFLGALNAAPGYGLTSVFSNTRAGQSSPVTGVTVGRVLDTMRSRRTSLPEERTAPVVVNAGGA